MADSFEALVVSRTDTGIAEITIHRPDQMNALNDQVFRELSLVLDELESDRELKGVIITGSGEKAFVAGADIKEFADFDASRARELSLRGQKVFQRIEDLPVPVIAAVNGYALGGGCELAMACHIRIASSNAALGLPEVSLGLIPGYGGTQRLSRLTGTAKALELTLSGQFVKAEEAQRIGLVNAVSEGSALDEARSLMGKISTQGPLAVRSVLQAVLKEGDADGFEHEAELFSALFETEDFREGTSAFMEKRKPSFSGK